MQWIPVFSETFKNFLIKNMEMMYFFTGIEELQVLKMRCWTNLHSHEDDSLANLRVQIVEIRVNLGREFMFRDFGGWNQKETSQSLCNFQCTNSPIQPRKSSSNSPQYCTIESHILCKSNGVVRALSPLKITGKHGNCIFSFHYSFSKIIKFGLFCKLSWNTW